MHEDRGRRAVLFALAEAGNPEAAYQLAHFNGFNGYNTVIAQHWLNEAANEGHIMSRCELGLPNVSDIEQVYVRSVYQVIPETEPVVLERSFAKDPGKQFDERHLCEVTKMRRLM